MMKKMMKMITVMMLVLGILILAIPGNAQEEEVECFLLKGSVVSTEPAYVNMYYLAWSIGDVELQKWFEKERVKITTKTREVEVIKVDQWDNIQVEFEWTSKEGEEGKVRVWTIKENYECIGEIEDEQKI